MEKVDELGIPPYMSIARTPLLAPYSTSPSPSANGAPLPLPTFPASTADDIADFLARLPLRSLANHYGPARHYSATSDPGNYLFPVDIVSNFCALPAPRLPKPAAESISEAIFSINPQYVAAHHAIVEAVLHCDHPIMPKVSLSGRIDFLSGQFVCVPCQLSPNRMFKSFGFTYSAYLEHAIYCYESRPNGFHVIVDTNEDLRRREKQRIKTEELRREAVEREYRQMYGSSDLDDSDK